MDEGEETVTLDELVKRMTKIETMGWALDKCIRTGLQFRRQLFCFTLGKRGTNQEGGGCNRTGLERHQKQQQQRRQRDFRLSYVELVCIILNFLVIHLGK